VAAVASQVLNVYLQAIASEPKVKEVIELETRLEALEGLLEARRDGGGRDGVGGRIEKLEEAVCGGPEPRREGSDVPRPSIFSSLRHRRRAGEPQHGLGGHDSPRVQRLSLPEHRRRARRLARPQGDRPLRRVGDVGASPLCRNAA
jgi:hypothetical protein